MLPGLQGTSLDVLLASMLNPEMVIASVQPIESLHALADLVRERKGKLTAADCVAHACRFPRVVHPDSVRGLVYQLYKAKQKGHKGVMLQSGLVKPGVVTPTMTVNFLSDIEGQVCCLYLSHISNMGTTAWYYRPHQRMRSILQLTMDFTATLKPTPRHRSR